MTTKTIAQQLNIKSFPFKIKNDKGNKIYHEDSTGDWRKYQFDEKGNKIYYEDSTGDWYKKEYDSNNNIIYFEDSSGDIEDNRPKKEYSMDEIAKALNIPVNQLKIKK